MQKLNELLQQLPVLASQYPVVFGQQNEDLAQLDSLSVTTTWQEVRAVLNQLRNGKSPGPSQIPTELLKICLEPNNLDATRPANPMAQIIFLLVSSSIDHGLIPVDMARSFVIPVPKTQAGSSITSEYRPISLMDSILKIACHVLKNRLSSVLHHLVSPEQAGFRRGEESNTQVAALRELVARRCLTKNKKESQPTFLAFLDFAQAFDSVPHSVLMQRLAFLGVKGRFLHFVSALYSTSTMIPRVGNFCANQVPLLRGVRQGCPLSPLLFNICIDAITKMTSPFGIPLNPRRKVGSLLFADDVVLLADSYESLCWQVNRITVWCHVSSMSLNAKKCAVMCVSRSGASTLVPPVKSLFGLIPSSISYKYLGVPFSGVDRKSGLLIVQEREKKVNAAYHSLMPALLMRDLPALCRVTLIKSFLIPIAAFGLEFVQVKCKGALHPVESAIANALRIVTAGSKHANCSVDTLRREYNVPPVQARILGSRARMFKKFQTSKTAIQFLFSDLGNLGPTWLRTTDSWLSSLKLPDSANQPRSVAKHVRDLTWRSLELSDKSESMKWYSRNSFGDTAIKLRVCIDRSLSVGISSLIQMRTNSFLTVPRLAHFVPSLKDSRSSCPCCSQNVCETFQHILLDCSAWSAERTEFVFPVLSAFGRFGVSLKNAEDKVQALLGGQVAAKFWTRKVHGVPLAAQVVKFLAAVIPTRRRTLFPP